MNAIESNHQLNARLKDHFVSVDITLTAARQTAGSVEAQAMLRKEKKSRGKYSVSLMPKRIHAAHKRAASAARKVLYDHGWERMNGSTKVYLVNIVDDLQLAYAGVKDVEDELLDTIRRETSDWDAYKEECLSGAGELEVDHKMFPYNDAAAYLAEFQLRLSVRPLPDVMQLPAALVDGLRDDVEASVFADNAMLISDLIDQLQELCDAAGVRILEGGLIRESTFSKLRRVARLAESLGAEADDVIKRVAPTVQQWLTQIDYPRVGDSQRDEAYAGKLAAAFHKAGRILRGEEE